MEDARARSNRMLDEYKAAQDQAFQEHQEESRHRADMQILLESEKIEREINKQLAIGQLDIKRRLGQKQEELKDKLFSELRDVLANFLDSADYQKLLERQVSEAVTFAGESPVIVYLDPADEDKSHRLALHHGQAEIRVSSYSFLGGIRAVIPDRHILIDNSFQTKLAEAREDFHFDLAKTAGGETAWQ